MEYADKISMSDSNSLVEIKGLRDGLLVSLGNAGWDELRAALMERLSVAGITVDECGLTHLAYSPEIAGAMLRRQQAEAVISARKKLVEAYREEERTDVAS